MNTSDWQASRRTARDVTEAKLLDTFPELEDVFESDSAPTVRLVCPRGHAMTVVQLRTRTDWNEPGFSMHTSKPVLQLKMAEVDAIGVVRPSEPNEYPDGPNPLSAMKANLRCPQPRCRYSGEHHYEKLLGLYAIALRQKRTTIRMPD